MRPKVNKAFAVLGCIILVMVVLLGLASFCGAVELPIKRVPEDQLNARAKLGATIITLAHPYGVAAQEGIEREAELQNFDCIVYDANWSAETQVAQIEMMIRAKYDVILAYPTSPGTIAAVVQKAEQAGIPVVMVQDDVPLPVSTHVGTNGYACSFACAEKLAEQLNGKGKVIVIGGAPGNYTAEKRKNGFRDALSKYPGIEIVAEQDGLWQRKKAKDVTEALLVRHKDANAVVSVGDEMTYGVIEALRAAGYSVGVGPDQVKVWTLVGGLRKSRELLLEGELAGIGFCSLRDVGSLSVDMARALLNGNIKGKMVQLKLFVAYTVVTKENIEDVPADRWF